MIQVSHSPGIVSINTCVLVMMYGVVMVTVNIGIRYKRRREDTALTLTPHTEHTSEC